MICAGKSNIFDTFSELDLNPNQKRTLFLRVYSYQIAIFPSGHVEKVMKKKYAIKRVLAIFF
jgi:hypothetical protein